MSLKAKMTISRDDEKLCPYFVGKDMFLLADGTTYHLGVKEGDLFPRILTVGCRHRAERIAKLLDKQPAIRRIDSSRDFTIFTGFFQGIGVSVVSIGMGAPMMDFLIREASFHVPGEMAVIRLGTCGLFNPRIHVGTVLTAGKGALYIQPNYSHFSEAINGGSSELPPYLICKQVPCDPELNDALSKKLQARQIATFDGLNASTETFYSCQGRNSPQFNDNNKNLFQTLASSDVDFVDMETHQLFLLAAVRKVPLHVAAACIGIVQRVNADETKNITAVDLHSLEENSALCCLDALVNFKLR